MYDFPEILSSQVALVRANYFTGQILNSNFKLFLANCGQKMYTVFDSLEDAEKYIESFKQEYEILVYFLVYDCNSKYINSYLPEEDAQVRWEEQQAIQTKQTTNSWWRKCIKYALYRR